MTASSAQVRFGPAGVAQVDSFVHLTGHSYIGCFTYQDEDMAPVLAIKDQHIDVSGTPSPPPRRRCSRSCGSASGGSPTPR